MPPSPQKKSVSIVIKRNPASSPRNIIASGYRLKQDKANGLIEILLEVAGQRGERVIFDPVLLGRNLNTIKPYLSSLAMDADDGAQKEDVPVGEVSNYSNVIQISQFGTRAETVFGIFSFSDWANAARSDSTAADKEILSRDSVVVFSTAAWQKKFLFDFVLAMENQEQK
jgi:hypothetical protein